tara:strand:- start:5140 stop:5646 length:507 start_codon:yes stop_codon:yes gene_type:complete
LNAEFITQPISGKYEEKIFDLTTFWKSQTWNWVKFTTNDGKEWIGVFRGEPMNVAVAENTNQVAILTSNGIYILDIVTKEVLFYDEQTDFRKITGTPTKDKFVVADYSQIGIIDESFNVKFIELDYHIDNVEFREYFGNKLQVSFEKMPDYDIVNGFLDTENWTIELE